MNLITGGTTLSRSWIALLSLTLAAISGCSFSGLGGTTRLSCPVPDGSMCKSISQTYADAMKTSSSAPVNGGSLELVSAAPARMPLIALVSSPAVNLVTVPVVAHIVEPQPIITERIIAIAIAVADAAVVAPVTTAATAPATSVGVPPLPPLPPVAVPPALMAAITTQTTSVSRPLVALPLRSAPRTMRVWIAPYEDADGDLNDQKFIYVQVDAGGWNVEHQRELATKRFAPLKAPAPTSSLTDKTDAAKALTAPAGQFK